MTDIRELVAEAQANPELDIAIDPRYSAIAAKLSPNVREFYRATLRADMRRDVRPHQDLLDEADRLEAEWHLS